MPVPTADGADEQTLTILKEKKKKNTEKGNQNFDENKRGTTLETIGATQSGSKPVGRPGKRLAS